LSLVKASTKSYSWSPSDLSELDDAGNAEGTGKQR